MRAELLASRPNPYNRKFSYTLLGVNGAVPISLDKFILRRKSVLISTLSLLVAVVMLTSCGQTYRPIVIPIPQPGGDPQALHIALVVNNNNDQPTDLTSGKGPSVSQFDVSGDTNTGNRRTGLGPIFTAISPGFTAFVVNRVDNSVSTFSLLVSNPTITTVALEPGAGASFADASGSLGFVSETALNRVAIVDSNLPAAKAFINVGAEPVALAATSDGRKVYVANTGDGTVTDISVQDNSVLGSPIPVGGVPASLALQTSNAFLFVVNSTGGALSVIDTSTDKEVQRFSGLSNPTKVVWDNRLQRVYVVNSGSNTINIYNGAAPSLTLLRTVALPSSPLGLAVLDDGSKFYVLFNGAPGSVGVYNTQSFQQTATVAVQNTPVSIAASPGSSKVYVVNETGDAGTAAPKFPTGSVTIIKTSDDTAIDVDTGAPKPVFVAIR
jgi:DNA-binding beta-propeller fold protein YncE